MVADRTLRLGKSSLALLLDAALGPASAIREAAWKLIDDASPTTGGTIRQVHRRHRTEDNGFHRALVTAGREPLGRTVLRALHAAVLRRYGKIPPAGRFRAAGTLRGALEDAAANDSRRTGPSPTAMVEIVRRLAEDAPLLLIIDEFGKNLEAIRDDADADPYLLQQLAEAGQGAGGDRGGVGPAHLRADVAAPVVRGPSGRRRRPAPP